MSYGKRPGKAYYDPHWRKAIKVQWMQLLDTFSYGPLCTQEDKGVRDYGCEQCGFLTRSASSLNSHKLSVHIAEKRFKCDQCEFETA